MTTLLFIKSIDQHQPLREVFESVVDADERVHLLRPPSVSRLDSLVQETISQIDRNVRYTTHTLPEGDTASSLVQLAIEIDADCICIGILNRTSAGKALIDELMESLLLHEKLSGDLTVGDHLMTLEQLEYELSS